MTEEKAISTSPEVASADTKADIKQSVATNEPQTGSDSKAETTVSTPNEQKEDKQKRKSGGFWGCLLDLFLVLLLTGALGGGGLGDLAIRYGYQRFQMDVMVVTVVVLIVMVQVMQSFGDWLSKKLNKNKL